MFKMYGLRELAASLLLLGSSLSGHAADKVVVGVIGSVGDAPFYLAADKGYFTEEGIEPVLQPMGSLAQQIAPLSSGSIDVACGAISAGLYNAISRDIPMKVVADKGRNAPGYAYNSILVRKDLIDSGAVKTLADMKGRTLATIGVGSADMSSINEAMRTVGLSYDDIKQTALTLPNHLVAQQNKAIDATLTPEPMATIIVERGFAVPLTSVDKIYPNQQQSVIVYGNAFIKDRRDVAQRFMNAYLKGVRAYMDGLKDGKIAGKNADEVIASVVKNTPTKDAELLRRIHPVVISPDGAVNVASVKKDWEFLRSKNLIQSASPPEDIIDMSFAEAAVKKLGPYKGQ
jgi:NitT/TauT family transport system substrate-binding protein